MILTPEDQARVEARKQQTSTPAEQNAEQWQNNDAPLSESLGEIARRYRKEMAAHEADLATTKKITPFPYKIPDDSLAEPKSEAAPLIAPEIGVGMNARSRPALPNLAPRSVPRVNGLHRKVSPFQPRPLNEVPPAATVRIVVVPSVPPQPPMAAAPVERSVPARIPGVTMRRTEVQRGQSWWKLAELYLGNGARWGELRKLNADVGGPPELLKLGSVLVVPEVMKAAKATTQKTIKVQKGDSLWSLARMHMGRGSAWICLASANPQIADYTHLAIGSLVQLPLGDSLKSCHSETVEKIQK